jgi:hypothetical protein
MRFLAQEPTDAQRRCAAVADANKQQILFENDLATGNMNRGTFVRLTEDTERGIVAAMIANR